METAKFRWKRRVGLGLLILTMCAIQASADNYSGKAGCVTSAMGLPPVGTVFDKNGTTALPATSGTVTTKVEYISIGSNSRIDGPTAAGAVTTDDIMVSSSGTTVGNDTAGNNFSDTAGKFWHSISGATGGGVTNRFYVRAWNKSPSAADAYFGESELFSAATATVGNPVPNNNPFNAFSTLFPKAAPTGPVVPAKTVKVGKKPPAGGGHSVDISFNTAFGARKYVVRQTDASGNAAGWTSGDRWNTEGRCSENNSGTITVTWSGLDELKKYYFKVEAWNTFGTTFSEVISFDTPEFPDPSPPEQVRDLKAEVVNNMAPYSVKLTWTAPADLDKAGTRVKVNGYEIKASTVDPMLDAPNAKPPIDTWTTAETITALGFASEPNLAPVAGGNASIADFDKPQEVLISGITKGGLTYFAVSGTDVPVGTAYNTGPISNLVAVYLGVTSVSAEALTFSLRKSEADKLVFNTVYIPTSLRGIYAQNLIDTINTKAGKKIVVVLSKWEDGEPVGLDGVTGMGRNFPLKPGEGYQLYVNDNLELTLP